MQIVYPLDLSIQQYIALLEEPGEAERRCPAECPQCETRSQMKSHGYYSRTIVDDGFDGVIRILRFLCRVCRRTVSLLPVWALPYMRYSVSVIGKTVSARIAQQAPWKAVAPEASYQRGQHWVRRFKKQTAAVSAALVALTVTVAAPDFESRALQMLEKVGWIDAHRFLFGSLRMHLLGWPLSLVPHGRRVRGNAAGNGPALAPHTCCMECREPSG